MPSLTSKPVKQRNVAAELGFLSVVQPDVLISPQEQLSLSMGWQTHTHLGMNNTFGCLCVSVREPSCVFVCVCADY